MKMLILCTGNSCRSQMAGGFLQSFNRNIKVYSTCTIPASKINARTITVMGESGIEISQNTPENISRDNYWVSPGLYAVGTPVPESDCIIPKSSENEN